MQTNVQCPAGMITRCVWQLCSKLSRQVQKFTHDEFCIQMGDATTMPDAAVSVVIKARCENSYLRNPASTSVFLFLKWLLPERRSFSVILEFFSAKLLVKISTWQPGSGEQPNREGISDILPHIAKRKTQMTNGKWYFAFKPHLWRDIIKSTQFYYSHSWNLCEHISLREKIPSHHDVRPTQLWDLIIFFWHSMEKQ